jgi:hypothetical protein
MCLNLRWLAVKIIILKDLADFSKNECQRIERTAVYRVGFVKEHKKALRCAGLVVESVPA